jgi:enamine deaminase RidA (YjgF/YER057c/UK114 family)
MPDPLPITLLSPPDMFRGQTYEHAAVVGDFVFCAGQVSRNAQGETVAPNDTAGQTGPLYANLRRVLEFAGCADDVVKVRPTVDHAPTLRSCWRAQQFFAGHRLRWASPGSRASDGASKSSDRRGR